ncbi:MAG TPA: membrane protein insertion efficiency factor YidD [Patescibacteria group bacterium]|nr:membrane protein insertion efficiency factor YidD [Patescibacteria group bacterium]
MKYILLGLLTVYQKTISPDHGWFQSFFPYGYCRFSPSCSEYSFQAIEKLGLYKGVSASVLRILACNPFSTPRADHVKIY